VESNSITGMGHYDGLSPRLSSRAGLLVDMHPLLLVAFTLDPQSQPLEPRYTRAPLSWSIPPMQAPGKDHQYLVGSEEGTILECSKVITSIQMVGPMNEMAPANTVG
jgi:hypothetical protein